MCFRLFCLVLLSWLQCLPQNLCLAQSVSDRDRAEQVFQSGKFLEAAQLYSKSVENESERYRLMADCYCKAGNYQRALELYKEQSALSPQADLSARAENLNGQAVCNVLMARYPAAKKLCTSALDLLRSASGNEAWVSRTTAHLAYIEYVTQKYAAAAEGFREAQRIAEGLNDSSFDALQYKQKIALASAGAYYHLKDFARAAEQFERMRQLETKMYGPTDLQTGWAMLALSDVYDKLGREKESRAMYQRSVYAFRKYNRDRLIAEWSAKLGSDSKDLADKIDARIFGKAAMPDALQSTEQPLFASFKAAPLSHEPCSEYVKPFTDAPGRAWVNPTADFKGIVICVHGLSLQHSTYDALARKLADKGYVSIAFDLRGFGTYQQALGAEHIDFDGCMQDLHCVVSAIKHDHPDKPIFMLGESMGGAIAVQFASEYPELCNGLIASVPAGKRFKGKATAVKVALKFVSHRNRPFNIGSDVINQATDREQVKAAWINDPMTRTDFSPVELVKFQHMINRNLEYARKLKNTPVIVFQGVGDKLVKPQATYEIFQAIASKDKELIMVGNAEHLIFEEGQFTPSVLQGLIGWMDAHV
jgi:pentatricopeptide repeat protein